MEKVVRLCRNVLCLILMILCAFPFAACKRTHTVDLPNNPANDYSYMDAYTYATLYLQTSQIKIEHNTSYTICTGTIKNTGTYTIKFVKIKGSFQDYSGKTLDTDWTYAVGAEGLSPGESTSFRMSVPKNLSIKKCSVSIIE